MTSWATPQRSKEKLSRRLGLIDAYGLSGLGLIVLLLTIGSVLALVIPLSVIYGGRAVNRTNCKNFATQSGYQTKFRILNWGATGTCFVKVGNKWVQKENIRTFVK